MNAELTGKYQVVETRTGLLVASFATQKAAERFAAKRGGLSLGYVVRTNFSAGRIVESHGANGFAASSSE